MFELNEWNPILFDLFILLVLIGLLFSFFALCRAERSKWSVIRQQKVSTKSSAFYLGVVVTLFYNYALQNGHLGKRPQELWKASEAFDVQNLSTFVHGTVHQALVEKDEKVIFITTTKYNLVQPAVLTKIGQALFPVRDQAIWVIVSTTTYDDFGLEEEAEAYPWMDESDEKDDEEERVQKNDTIMTLHLKSVDKRLKRFGVSYILLQVHDHLDSDMITKLLTLDEEDRRTRGLYTGLVWTLRNLKNGIVMLAHEEYAYNYRIFEEVVKTKVASTWPVGLRSYTHFGFSSPIVQKGETKVKGYHDGNGPHWGKILMEIGAFAVNIRYLQNNVEPEELWKMVHDGFYSMDSIGIDLENVQVLAEHATKILVWRTRIHQHPWPKVINIKESFKGTNMMKLFKNIFGVRFPYMKKNWNYTDKTFKTYI